VLFAVFAPELVFTVIIAEPAPFAVTRPEADTVATAALLLDHITFLSVALLGDIVTPSC
jgi:hypothetical protein